MIYRDYVCEEERRKDLLKLQQEYMDKESRKNRRLLELNEECIMKEAKKELIQEKKWYEKIIEKIKVLINVFKRW